MGHGANEEEGDSHARPLRECLLTDEEQVVSCGADGNIIVTHVPRAGRGSRAKVRHLFTCHNDIVNRIVIDPNGSNVYFTCGGNVMT
ncbi:uncharacterized protein ACA1_033890 [Acanthamoeba castellanii str. Neff]|uniref:Uncharacterized protein n=1 Tax=Acanthamoeba castellanii (strain ATCC 30010 / Neff) TaxID=1257118 RepID=L8GWJ1_ACACF|nr:uncharacterized protein ACA1_033890 [Acanthamoeba castellanii str. Neff]ELR16461.1 hypothetical protein ACA1_033890 [Acanthamoeba castellanii str. Neff]